MYTRFCCHSFNLNSLIAITFYILLGLQSEEGGRIVNVTMVTPGGETRSDSRMALQIHIRPCGREAPVHKMASRAFKQCSMSGQGSAKCCFSYKWALY